MMGVRVRWQFAWSCSERAKAVDRRRSPEQVGFIGVLGFRAWGLGFRETLGGLAREPNTPLIEEHALNYRGLDIMV